MARRIRSIALRYGLPVICFALMLLLSYGLRRFFSLGFDVTPLVIIVMIASAWYGGRGPGLLIAVLFEAVIDYATGAPFTLSTAAVVFNRLILFVSLVLFASSRRKAESRLRQQQELLRVTLSSIGDGVIATDIRGAISFINPTAESLTGWTATEASGKPIEEVFRIINEETRERLESPFSAIKKAGAVVGLANHTLLVTKDGQEIPIDDSGAPIKDQYGNMIGAIIVFHDVSERRRTELEREQLLRREQSARSEAEVASRLKDEFLATVSHELRTPLNAILGWSLMLRRGNLDKGAVARALETIERNAKSQAQLIEDLLDVSRVITGKLRMNKGLVDLKSVVASAIDSLQLAADSKGIELSVVSDSQMSPVLGDSGRLQQVLWNLLSNAIRFTPSGGRVEVRTENAGSDAQIIVSDTGQGISPDFLPYIFDRFRQADGTITRSYGGLGLGLAIVRHLVELHGGTVHVHSPGKGQGATFTISLPFADAAVRANIRQREAEDLLSTEETSDLLDHHISLEGVQVLLVDDDYDTLSMLTVMLQAYGVRVQATSSADEAVEVLQWYSPDVLISDLAMPDRDGYWLIDKVRAMDKESGGQTPTVALTALVRVEDRMRALSAGFDMFVPKPVEPQELIEAIANLAQPDISRFERA